MPAKDTRGFTLIELLIVVVIIGILASIAIPKFQAVRQKAYRSALMSDLKNLATQQEVYHNAHFTFSTNMAALGATTSDGVNLTINTATNGGWGATATHQGITTGQCGIFHGDAAQTTGDPATVAGVVTCNF